MCRILEVFMLKMWLVDLRPWKPVFGITTFSIGCSSQGDDEGYSKV